MKKQVLLALGIALSMGLSSVVLAEEYDLRGDAAGPQLNRTMEMLERARIAQQIEEDRARQSAQITDQRQEEKSEIADVQFQITGVDYGKSEVLTDEQIQAITSEYLNKDIHVSDLYQMLGKINNLYADGGYVTCKAFLPPQKVTGGVIKILLVEGKTGKVSVVGNKTTATGYVTRRIELPGGQVENLHHLNKKLTYFNGTNDAQVRVMLEAGQEPGTTDFVLQVYEPQQINHTIFTDNAGNYSSGMYRAGYFMNVKSLTGSRDSLTMGTILAEGLKSFSAVYSVPLSPSGTQLSLAYSTNSTKIVQGEAHDDGLDIKGHSSAYSATLRQPWVVNETTRSEIGVEYNYQSSSNDYAAENIRVYKYKDETQEITPYFSHTTYGKSHVFYQKYSYAAFGNFERDEDAGMKEKNVHYYKANAYYQKAYKHGQMWSARLDGQIEEQNNLSSSKWFYIGGMNSVRGYKESFLGGERGFSSSLEYQFPISKDRMHNLFLFYDYGIVGGDSAFDDHVLQSVGIGMKNSWNKHIYSSVCIAFPLIREFPVAEQQKVSKTRLHFLVSGQM